MSTQAYYKDRLGFDPNDSLNGDLDQQQGYEENLSKFKDERDAIQKKTFTKWVNKHLKKANRHINDLFIDLQDGLNLISLLEVLSGEQLPREKGRLRFHMLQNVQMALDFLRYKKIKLVNIRAEDIVDGNPKLTLGLIWTIILHFQISDIVVGEESNVSAKDALLKWARRSTAKYPGVRVNDFTSSWKDGLAFNAIIHRNRPDLIDWRNIRNRVVRERLEQAFYVAEKEYGVTRLLDPEDVDTHEVDEKSIITYISSLYDVFPEPPTNHPLYDSEAQQKIEEYRDVASSLHLWLREKTAFMQDRNFPSTLVEMKKIAQESNRVRVEEIPTRHREKQRLQHLYRDLQRHFESVGEVDIEPELHIDVIERNWNRMLMAHQERDQLIHDEIKRSERMQRLAEKVHREVKRIDTRLEDMDTKIKEEARRLERLHPLDAKHNVDILEQELRVTDENIQTLFSDVQSLRDGRYPQASDLHKRVEKLHQKWMALRTQLHNRLITPLSTMSFPFVEEHTVTRQSRTILESRLDSNPYFKNLEECIEWCSKKLKQIKEAENGSDLPGVQAELNAHLREHNSIEQFHSRCEQCINAKSNFHGEELNLYTQQLNTLQKLYTELLSTSNKRLSDLETLQDFLQSATKNLEWLSEKEEIEVTRDWSDRDLNLANVQQYYHSLMSELDKREIQFSAVQDRGESLLLQNHPASKTIESYMTAMNNQWSWILQLTLALETHLKHASYYQQFYKDVKEAENWLNKRDEILNTVYSQSDFTIDEGEQLLKGMQELREELNQYGEVVESLAERAQNVVPLKQRRLPVTRPIPILAVCNYKHNNVSVEKGDQWILHDNSGRIKWRVSSGATGSDCNIPGVVFLIPPPDKEALEAIDRLKRQFERTTGLWQRKQLRMRQNMIFATINVVKGWTFDQFLAMGADQRNAIRKALNEDAAKLLEEGDPADPQLRRLRREMDEVNRLFDEFERRAREEEESKNAIRIFNEQASSLQAALDEAEHTLNTRLSSPIPRDVDSLEHMVIQHKDFETRLRGLQPEIEAVQDTLRSVTHKTPGLQSKLDRILNQWNNLWNLCNLYVERLKCVEIVLSGLNEVNHVLSDFEIKLASYGEMPSELDALKAVHKDLLSLQNRVTNEQRNIDQLLEDGHNTRRLVEKSRHHLHTSIHHDLDRLDNDLNKIQLRWNNICSQLVDRLKSCETAYSMLEKFANSYQAEAKMIEESYQNLNTMTPPAKSQVIETNGPTQTLYKKVIERVPAVEQVNIDGGKFIREAKIYDLRLLHYCDWLIDEIHPSLEASVPIKTKIRSEHISGSGEAAVSHDLDVLNNRFGALVSVLYDRLKQLVLLYPDDLELKELVDKMEPKPLKTFRTEFSIYEQSCGTPTKRLSNGVNPNNNDSSHYVSTSSWDVVDTSLIKSKIINNYESTISMGNNKSMNNGNHVADGTQFGFRNKDTMVAGDNLDILRMKGIVHPKTGEILTLEEAIRLRILDVRTGKIAISPNSKSAYVNIEEAVKRKLVIPELMEKLLGPCGVMANDGKKPMSLLEAIQRELMDAERGPMERLKVNMDADDELSASIAETGLLVKSGNQQVTILNLSLSLSDLLSLDLVDRKTGLILDRDSGQRCSIEEMILRRILDPEVREIVDSQEDDKVTVSEALVRGLLQNGKYFHKLSNEKISLYEAKRRRLIIRPLSLKDCLDLEVLKENGLFRSPIYRRDLPLIEAIERAVVDLKNRKTIMDVSTKYLLTLSEALCDGVVTSDANYVDKSTNKIMTLKQAGEKGFLYSIAVKSVFDIAAFRINVTEEWSDFNSAFDAGIFINNDGKVYMKCESDEVPLSKCADEGLIKQDMLNLLNKKVGIMYSGLEINVIEAAVLGFINSRTGFIIDPETKEDIPFVEAINRRIINEEGVAALKSLLAINLSTQTITKTIITYSTTVQFPKGDRRVADDTVEADVSESSQSESTVRLKSIEDASESSSEACKSPEMLENRKKSGIKEKIIKMLQPLEMKDSNKNGRHELISGVEVPVEGWDLEMAVVAKLIDPVSGMLIIPGTDRQVSFEECIRLEIINPKSAVVIEPLKKKKISLMKSLEKQILDCTGHYQTEDEKITLNEAIEKQLICFETTQCIPKTRSDQEITNLEPVRILPNVIFDPQTALVIFIDDNTSDDVCNAVKSMKIDPQFVKISIMQDESSLKEAIEKEIINIDDRTCNIMNNVLPLANAIKNGDLKVLGTPLVATIVTESVNNSDETGVDATSSRNSNPGSPLILQKMRRRKVKPSEAVDFGVIDVNTASFFESLGNVKDSNGKLFDLMEALELFETDSDRKLIKDPRTGDMFTIREAINCGIIDKSSSSVEISIPVARSLSLPELLKQGLLFENKIIHPETGEYLTLEEAIACDVVDPMSKIKDPVTGEVVTLKEAMNVGIIENLKIVIGNERISIPKASDIGNIFLESEFESLLPPAAMSLAVATRIGVYDESRNVFKCHSTGEEISLEQAKKENLLTLLPDDENFEKVENFFTIDEIQLKEDTILVDKVSNVAFTVKQAISENLIDLKTGSLVSENSCGKGMKVTDAIKLGLLAIVGTPILVGQAVIDALSKNDETRQVRKLPMVVTKHITAEELARVGVYDVKKRVFLDPNTGNATKFKNVILNENVFQVEQLYVKDLNQFDLYVPLKSALAFEIVDEDGFMTDPTTEKKVSFFECVKLGWITELQKPVAGNMDLKNALNAGIVDRENCTIVNITESGEEYADLLTCLRTGIINLESVMIRDVHNNELISLIDAVEVGLVDLNRGTVAGAEGRIDFATAFNQALIIPKRIPMSLIAVVKKGYYNRDDGMIFDDAVAKFVDLEESIARGIIDAALVECKDVKNDEYVPLRMAIDTGLIDNGQLVHTVSGKLMKLDSAIEQNLIVNRYFSVTVTEAVQSNLYDPKIRKVFNPHLGNWQTVQQAIDLQMIDATKSEIKNPFSGKYMSIHEAIVENIVDLDKGLLLSPSEMTLTSAVRLEYVRDKKNVENFNVKPNFKSSKQIKLATPVSEPEIEIVEETPCLSSYAEITLSRKQSPRSNIEYRLEDAIGQNFIDPNIAMGKNPQTNEFKTVNELLENGFLTPELKVKFVPSASPHLAACKISSRKGYLYTKKPASFKKAIDDGLLNIRSCRFKNSNCEVTVSLKDAVNMGLIDSDSLLLKDYTNKKLLSLAEALSKGMFDCDKNTIIDTQSSRLFNLADAMKNELIVTEGLSLLDSLEFGFYNSYTGLFIDPFHAATERASPSTTKRKRELSLEQCVKENIINESSILVKDGKGLIRNYKQAVEELILDAVMGKYFEASTGKSIDLQKAKNCRYILAPASRQAMEERYRLCDISLNDLLAWIGEIEDKLANQDVVQEDVNQLRNQINILKLLKEEIDSQTRPVTNCLDQVRQVVATGSEYLSRDEINNLEKKAKQLRTRYDRVNERTDKLLRRIQAARDELTKFKNDLTVFITWMEKAQRTVEEKEKSISNLNRIDGSIESIRDFVSDVIAHQADLRFITMAAQKFVDESKEYLTCLNEFRTSLPARLPHIEPISAHDSVVRNTVANVSSQYRDLLNRVNALSDKLSGLGSKQKEYRDALNAAKAWLREVEPRAHKLLIEPVAADPAALEDQLGRCKALNNELVSQSRVVDSAKQALDALLRSVGDQLSPSEIANLKNPVADVENKYRQLCDSLAEKCQTLDTALVQSQGVQDALDGLLHWLNDAENTLKNITRPASLHKERLEDQMREHRVLQADVDSHKASVDSVTQSAKQLINTSNPRLAKKIETKLRDVNSRYDKLMDKTVKRGDLLAQIHNNLTVFNDQAASLERWLGEALEIIPEASNSKIEDLIAQKEALKTSLDQVVHDGKALINHKDVTDTANLRDRIKALEQLWKELNLVLDDKHRNSKLRQEQLSAYEKLKDQVLFWLTNMENKVNRLEPVAVEMETVKKQIEEIKPLLKEHREYASTIDKVNDLGNVFDSLSRPETPTRRRNTASPTKRSNLSTPYGRRGSQDSTPSPSRGLAYLTQSPGGSSGFGSRRSSQDGFIIDEISEVQQQLSEINNRYSLLGVRLTDRQSELDSIKDELRKHLEHLKTLSQFLDKIQRVLPKESIPQTKDEADKMVKNIKGILEEIYEKQAVLESTKAGINDLLRRKPSAFGANLLQNELQEIVKRWKTIHDSCKDRIQILEDLKDFHDSHDNMANWLNAKDRMMTVLGPISSDSRMVQSQVQQVQVLREEFRTQQPQLDHFVNLGENILVRIPDRKSLDAQKISTKLSNIQKKWNDLLSRLEERAESLGAAADTSREFDAGLMRLRDALQSISDQLDDIPHDKEPDEKLRKIQSLERQLEGQRPLLADLEAAGAQLCEVLTDPTSRAEIQGKLSAVNRQYNNLQKKLDNRKAEIEGLLRDGQQFENSCARFLGWLAETLGSIPERLLISADREILQQQLEQHEPIYKDVMNKEHEIIMLLNKGKDLLARNSQQNRTDTRNLQKDLDKIQQQWDKLRKDTVDRQTRLQTCWEHCKKYYRALEAFIPWLSQAENKLDSLRPDTFKRTDVEKQLRELSLFRNDVWKHSGEFENLKALGETFLAACDVDKELVRQELAAVKTRWDKLNNELLERTQWLEDTARRLAEFSENLRDLTHSVQRFEDRLASHDALGGASRDPKMLERIKNLREEATGLKKPLQSLRQTAKDLIAEAAELGVGNASHLLDDVDNLTERLNDLLAKLDDRCSQLQSASTALAQYNEKIKGLSLNLSTLEQELDAMKPIGRDTKTVRSQLDDIIKFIKKVVNANDDVQTAVDAGEHLVDAGFSTDTAVTREQTEGLIRQLNRLDERARNRENDLETMLDKLQEFQKNHTAVMDDIVHAGEELRRLKPVGSEVEIIKSQQEEFQTFRLTMIEPLARSVGDVNRNGQGLIQSAAGGVNTSGLEKDLEKMNDKWNALKDKLNERDRKLDVGLLHSGKFQEALAGLAKWLTDTEELVANQKPPSADYKVVKAQLQEQKFLKKMLLDRQNSMSSLFAMGNEVAASAEPNERKAIERQLHDLMQRFDNLTEGAAQRMNALEQAMAVAKEFQDKLVPILDWLDNTEKKVKDMELIPTDEEKIQQRIKEHDALHKDILRKKPDFTELTEVASHLMTLVGEDEAAGVADKLQETADRYTTLVDASENVGQLLQASRTGLRHLVLTYQDLQAWMENMDNRLNRHKIMPVHTEKLLRHMEDLADVTEEISNRQTDVDSTVDSGLELMKHISNDEAIQLKDKLDSLQRRYRDLVSRGADLLKAAQETLPLVQQFHNSHNRLVDWMMDAESQLQAAEPREEEIARLEMDIQEFRPVLENINLIGPQLCQISPGEGAATIEGLVTRDNRRFDAIVEQIQRKAERINLSKQRSLEVIGDIDELLDWFREVENQLRDAEPPSSEADIIRLQLKEHKALNDDISSQKSRVRDVISTAKKVLRESVLSEEITVIREKMEDLKDIMEVVSRLSLDRLSILEQAYALANHFQQTHVDLSSWLDDMERQVAMLAMPALRPDLIAQQQDKNEMLIQSINEHRPLVEKLNKTGEALIKLVNPEEGAKVQDILDSINARYGALRVELRERQQALEKALQETSKFSDKLEGMLRALQNTAEQVAGADPISAHPPRIRDQIDENAALVEDLDKREEAFLAVKKAANDVINKAPNASDPAVRDMKRKLEKLNNLWNEVQKATSDRGRSLEDALALAEKFWDELQAIMATLRDLQDNLNNQEPPAVRPEAIHRQQIALQEIKAEIDQTKPEVEQCRASGHQLMRICGEPDKPEVKKHIEDLDNAWDNITALFAKREENLINAMEKAMEFHETLQAILDFLDQAEIEFAKLGPLGTDIDAVKRQIAQLKQFKQKVDPHMVKVEALNRQAQELTERTSVEQAAALREPLASVNRRWDELLRGIVERQRQLENALLRLGQFQHALQELLTWIDVTNRTLDNELKPVAGDPQLLEVELAKLKVLVNDIQAHQSSVDTLNDAGRQIIESGKGTVEASSTQDKLATLNKKWRDLLQKAADRQLELEDALRDAQRFAAEIQDLLSWLGEVDGIIAASKPVGGLPETASEQLERFMEVYNELEDNRPKVETVLAQGQEYLKKSPNASAGNLQHNLKTLKQRWDSVTARANDKKIKLEIALKEATEFHDALQAFIDWLTNAEKVLTNLKPVSRVLSTILSQIEDHKAFQKDVSAHREAMLHLDKKGTHLKYFSQKQDVILIKNLLISVQHRWERVVAKSAERTRALDHGYKEAKEFHDAWSGLMNWLTETEKGLDELALEAASIGNAPEKIKQRLAKHREFQRALSGKQATYDSTMRMGKALKEKAPKTDESQLKQMMSELKEKWNTVCAKSVDRQRKLEEALLYCGQFKDALQALLDWLKRSEKELSEDGPVHGDLDTVTALIDQHKAFEQEFFNRSSQLDTVKQTANELISKANAEDAANLKSQLNDVDSLWNRVNKLSERRSNRLMDALKDAEELHRSVHMLLEWLSDAEMKLRFAATLPEDDLETKGHLSEHEKFLRELVDKEREKDATIHLAQRILEKAHPDAVPVIKHWITIIQSRWDEVSSWAKQREEKLKDHLRSLQDLDSLLEELLAWLQRCENQLLDLESQPLPDEIAEVERLIEDHNNFMESMAERQHDIDTVCKTKPAPLVPDKKQAGKRTNLKSSRDNLDKGSRWNLKEKSENVPHIGPRFPPKGSKSTEPSFRNSRCKQLYDKWRNVWLMAWERQRRLQERLDYLKELEKVRNFSWDEWRKRFLKFINHKKSRLTDLFRKMDKNNDGLVPREDFIDGIMKTKFDTSKLEMNAVADMFDHDNLGLIDWKEFIAALRPDWEEKRPPSEAEKIHDEVKRLVMLCTCRQKFRVFQVGEGKYRFGDSQKLRLVRILRSTVMVRVGGGWVALDEFLVKNDPCRVEMLPMPNPYIPEEHEPWCPYSLIQLKAKGRTNIELREQFILADGVSQSMSAFKSKPTEKKSVSLNSNIGPITKIRERSTRSVPLGKTVNRNIGTPDSLSDTESSPYARTPVRKATPTFRGGSLPGSRGNSRPASRQGSKPPSRHGSNLSLDSTDDATPSRIPRRSTSSSKSGVSLSSSRKPLWNESLSSNTRSPSGIASPVSESRYNSAIHRASSIPTLSATNSSSRIPVYVGHSSSDTSQQISISSSSSGRNSDLPTPSSSHIPLSLRLRTPSGSSTPAPTIPGSRLTRKSSAASDSSRKSSKTPTPTDLRAPFRL